jgi:hypothetical protein
MDIGSPFRYGKKGMAVVFGNRDRAIGSICVRYVWYRRGGMRESDLIGDTRGSLWEKSRGGHMFLFGDVRARALAYMRFGGVGDVWKRKGYSSWPIMTKARDRVGSSVRLWPGCLG